MIKIKFCIWWNFGKPEIRNLYATVTRLENGKYRIVSTDGNLYDAGAKFATKERFFYTA